MDNPVLSVEETRFLTTLSELCRSLSLGDWTNRTKVREKRNVFPLTAAMKHCGLPSYKYGFESIAINQTIYKVHFVHFLNLI